MILLAVIFLTLILRHPLNRSINRLLINSIEEELNEINYGLNNCVKVHVIGLSLKLHKDSLGAGGTTTLNRKSSKINDLRDFKFRRVTESLMDFLIFIYLCVNLSKKDKNSCVISLQSGLLTYSKPHLHG
jgi:hypothetical protein